MFSEGGQPLHVHVARGGGKGGGGGGGSPQAYQPPPPVVLTDPVSGKSFVDKPAGITGGRTGWMPMPGGGYAFIPADQGSQGPSAQEQLNAEIDQRKAEEKATSDAAKAEATTTAANKESTFLTNRTAAYKNAYDTIIRNFQQQGADPSQYITSDINPALERQLSTIQDLDPNPAAAFSPDLGQTIINNIVSGKRTQATNALNQTFTPNYTTNLLPDTTTAQYASGLVNEQFDPLMSGLTNAQKRGTLTGAGYNAALDALNQKKAAAMNTVNTLGSGILSTDRKSLDDYISGARSDVNNLNLTSTFDPSTYAGAAASKAQGYLGDFGGALRNAVGQTKFADLSDLINAGGAVQGATNPNAANPAGGVQGTSPAFTPEDTLAQQKRGLGNVGAF